MSNDTFTNAPDISDPAYADPPRSASAYRYLLLAALFMLVGLMVLVYIGRERGSHIGKQLGELELEPLLNVEQPAKERMSKSSFKLVHFWGPWCNPCMVEYPEIIKLQRKYADDNRLAVISVSCGLKMPQVRDDLEFDTKLFVQGLGGDLPIYYDPNMYSRVQVSTLIGQQGFAYPTTVLLDSEMKIVKLWVGATQAGELDQAVTKALSK